MNKKKPTALGQRKTSKQKPSSKANTILTANLSKWIPIKEPLPVPAAVKETISTLSKNGYLVYIVGGSVRDHLLGLPIKDYDLVTDASPNEIEALFPHALTIGKQFGVIKLPPPYEIEIATFREDLEYTDHRRPNRVKFAGPLEDAQRRDFTINALFYDPKNRKILDQVGGYEDLKNKILRAIGNPKERFKEDALRVLRAFRFAARFQLGIETRTLEALMDQVKLLRKISMERIQAELTLMWKGPHPDLAFQALKKTGIIQLLLSEALSIKPEIFTVGSIKNPSTALVWAMALSEMKGDDLPTLLKSTGQRLKLSNEVIQRVIQLITDLPKFNEVFKMREATLQRWLREPYFDELLAFYQAYARIHGGNLMAYHFCSSLRKEFLDTPSEGNEKFKLITGEDLIQLGFQPGPTFSEIIKTIEDLGLEKKLTTKEEALEYVIKHFVD